MSAILFGRPLPSDFETHMFDNSTCIRVLLPCSQRQCWPCWSRCCWAPPLGRAEQHDSGGTVLVPELQPFAERKRNRAIATTRASSFPRALLISCCWCSFRACAVSADQPWCPCPRSSSHCSCKGPWCHAHHSRFTPKAIVTLFMQSMSPTTVASCATVRENSSIFMSLKKTTPFPHRS